MSFDALGTDCQLLGALRSACMVPPSFQALPILWKLTRDFPDVNILKKAVDDGVVALQPHHHGFRKGSHRIPGSQGINRDRFGCCLSSVSPTCHSPALATKAAGLGFIGIRPSGVKTRTNSSLRVVEGSAEETTERRNIRECEISLASSYTKDSLNPHLG